MLRGREQELTELQRATALALQGQQQIHALVGEPGIGKTALATEASARAGQQGVCVAWGRAWEAGGAAAYWPWRQLIAGLPATAEQARLTELWGRSGAGEFSSTDPAMAQMELFEAVVAALRVAVERAPLLCVLDDLHMADTASLELLAFVLHGLRLGRCAWLLTWRDAEAERPRVSDLIASIAREATVLPLRPLSESAAAGLIADTLGVADPATAQTLFRATSGNPLFLVEVLRSLALRGTGAEALSLEQVPVTQGVALVVRERTRHLAADALAVLEAASIIGRELDLPSLTDASGEPAVRVRELVGRLSAAGFFRERGGDAWSFSHALVRDALYRALESPRRRALHLRFATALDARIEKGEPGLARVRAHHGLNALPLAEAGQVARWAIAAATEARAQCAYEDAVGILESTHAQLSGDERIEAELLLALGWAHGDAGRTLGMRESLQRAMQLARKLGDAHLLARAVIGYGSRYVLGDVRTDLLPLLDEAEAALGAERGGLHARLLARRAAAMTPADDADASLEMARAALVEVANEPDRRTFIDVAVAAGSAFGDHADPAERISVNTQLLLAAREERDHVLELRGLGRLVTDYLEAGDIARADATLGEWNALCATVRHPRFVWMAPLFRSMRGMLTGAFREAPAAIEEAISLAAQAQDENARRSIAVHRHWLYLLQDDVAGLRAHEPEVLAALGTSIPMAALGSLVRISTLARAGHLDAVRAETERSLPLGLPRLQATLALMTLGEAIAPLGPTPHGRAVRERLSRRTSSNGVWGLFGFTCGTPATLVLGQLAEVESDSARARTFFAAALARAQAMGAPVHEAWVRYGWALASLRHAEQAACGREQLERAGELADRLEMRGLAARARAALSAAGGPRPASRPPTPGALTFTLEREGEGWRVVRGAQRGYVRDVRGMGMLAKLVARPNEELHSLELATSLGSGEVIDAGDSGELLDDAARSAYKRRARELSEALDESEALGDSRGAEAAQAELEALARELSRAQGLGGRKRHAGVAAERARVVVQRRVREAIRKVAQVDAELGAHLETSVRTGIFCSYVPLRTQKQTR